MAAKDQKTLNLGDFFKKIPTWSFGVVGGVAVASLAVGFFYWSSQQAKLEEERARAKKRAKRHVYWKFVERKEEILKYIGTQEWNFFSHEKLGVIYDAFKERLPDSSHGLLKREDFHKLCLELKVDKEPIIESFFLFWDTDHSGSINFIELIEGLNLLCHGAKRQQLRRFFDVYDLNHDKHVSFREFHLILTTFFPNMGQEEAQAVFQAVDKKQNQRLTLQEFLSIADHPELNFTSKTGFTLELIRKFGLTENDIEERNF